MGIAIALGLFGLFCGAVIHNRAGAAAAAFSGAFVVWLSAPYLGDAVPRWVLIGVAGALLIAMGVTWESRLKEARAVLGYVRALR